MKKWHLMSAKHFKIVVKFLKKSSNCMLLLDHETEKSSLNVFK